MLETLESGSAPRERRCSGLPRAAVEAALVRSARAEMFRTRS
nr:hypothetical protein [Streptomyces buecherae]